MIPNVQNAHKNGEIKSFTSDHSPGNSLKILNAVHRLIEIKPVELNSSRKEATLHYKSFSKWILIETKIDSSYLVKNDPSIALNHGWLTGVAHIHICVTKLTRQKSVWQHYSDRCSSASAGKVHSFKSYRDWSIVTFRSQARDGWISIQCAGSLYFMKSLNGSACNLWQVHPRVSIGDGVFFCPGAW